MIIQALAFYLFALIAVAAGVMVISARNPVHSVLFLILAFFNSAGLFVLMGAEFLAMILVVVYVGAVAVLFLFVVMMLDINYVAMRQGFLQYLPIGGLVGPDPAVRAWSSWSAQLGGVAPERRSISLPIPPPDQVHNTKAHRPRHLYQVRLPLSGRGPGPAGRHDRRNRADACASAKGCAASRLVSRSRASGKPRSRAEGRAVRDGESDAMLEIGLAHYLTVAAILFTLGIFGIFLNRKNVIIILMSIELMLLAVNINLVAFSTHLQRPGRAGLRHVRADRRGGGGRHRPRHPGGLLPQPRLDRGRRHQS